MEIFNRGESLALLGSGWHAFEAAGADSFRWVGDDARLNVAQLTRAPFELCIEIEPGPAVGNKPFDLAIVEDGATIATLKVVGRETVRVAFAAGAPRVHILTLKAINAAPASPAPGDPRILKFRIFRVAIEESPSDVVSAANGLIAGKGWYPLEEYNGDTFRWVGPEAVIEAQAGAQVETIVLDVEPGPGVGAGPLKLKIFAGDKQHGDITVTNRETIHIPWPKNANGDGVRLRVEGGGKMVATDPRVMNFRVFATAK